MTNELILNNLLMLKFNFFYLLQEIWAINHRSERVELSIDDEKIDSKEEN